ncbi:phosphate ABC transporter substrate-binding protein PstS [Arthrobacter sp. MYb211]|uniref:phosphate ABC transporter substrate-binding protein PstS n=1 Tax=unclassified Arthrobacter TaxID=235627 RepID=UPI000CFBEE9A|nr:MULTISPECIES: phosphate ABC transporter substrate-binding protein PstS [unclassified Arthrobacter]PRA10245.1 phosphate ABC transporter substrate-binding protein PstS [Arthrobacter sp. MYb221]PRC05625.1 phosphate ABC transporter substrate-binding protein PstS [Arthrobacter sp. MYb211]
MRPSLPRRSASARSPKLIVAASLVATLLLAGCGSDYPLGEAQRNAAEGNTSNLKGTLTGGGSTAQNSAMNAWTTEFATLHPKVQVQYASVGSGAGRAGLLAGGTEFAGSDAYLKEEEVQRSIETCGPQGAINIPAYISPITIAFNLPGISELNMDAETVARIFSGEIRSWQDPAITALNPGVELPDVPLTGVARADDSGTTENFTEYLHSVVPEAWDHEPDGGWPDATGLEKAQGNAGVVTTVTRAVGAVTYADDSLVDENLGKVKLKVGGEFVAVSGEAAALAVAESERVEGRKEHDIALELDRKTTAEGAYPLVLVSYLLFCSSYADAQTVELAKTFGQYVVSDKGQKVAADSAKSAPMPERLAEEARTAIDSITASS